VGAVLRIHLAKLCNRGGKSICDSPARPAETLGRGGGSLPREIDLGGILVAPFVRYLFLALVIVIAVRFVVGHLGLRSMFANPPLAEAALYVCILVSLMAFWI
jgi:hypothetical protein